MHDGLDETPFDWKWSMDFDSEHVRGINNTTFRFAHLERLEAIHAELHGIRRLLSGDTQS